MAELPLILIPKRCHLNKERVKTVLILEEKHLLSRIQPQFEPDSVPAPIAAPLVREDDAAAEADREDEAPVGAVGGEQLALVRRLERGED